MKRTMVVLAHPDMEKSVVNKKWIEELQKHNDKIIIHDLHKEYPDCIFDIDREHNLLESVENIILQFPLYWYSSPPILKKWLDDVLSYGWAYGDDETADYKMKGKKIGLAVTVGAPEESHTKNGSVGFLMDEVLIPFKATIKYIGSIELSGFIFYDAVPETGDEKISESAKKYSDYVLNL